MKLLLLIVLIGVGFVVWLLFPRSESLEGLFIPRLDEEPTIVAERNSFNLEWRVDRLELARAVFRSDTEDDSSYWIELDFTKWADPGDMYLFRVGDKELSGFSVRGEGSTVGGGRWALGIDDLDAGRTLLQEISEVYRLDTSSAIDQTKGEQDGAR